MATGTVAPVAVQQFFDNNGDPLTGGKLYAYAAGTSTPLDTFSDVTLLVANPNPLILNSAGRPAVSGAVVQIFLSSDIYKFVLKTSADVTLWTADNVEAVPTVAQTVEFEATAGDVLSANDCCYLSDGQAALTVGKMYKAEYGQTYSATLTQIGFAVEDVALNFSGKFRSAGLLDNFVGLTTGASYYIGVAGAITATAPGNRRRVGQAISTTTLAIDIDQPLLHETTLTVTGAQNALAIGEYDVILLNPASSLTINGVATGGISRRVAFHNLSAQSVTFENQSGSASAENRIKTATGASRILPPDQTLDLVYYWAGRRWVEVGTSVEKSNTWVPVLGGAGGTTGQTYAGATSGTYVKNGRIVVAHWYIVLTAKGTITGNVELQGLPFTVSNVTSGYAFGPVLWENMATNFVNLIHYANPNTTTASIRGAAAAAATNNSALSTTDIADTTSMGGTLVYFTTA